MRRGTAVSRCALLLMASCARSGPGAPRLTSTAGAAPIPIRRAPDASRSTVAGRRAATRMRPEVRTGGGWGCSEAAHDATAISRPDPARSGRANDIWPQVAPGPCPPATSACHAYARAWLRCLADAYLPRHSAKEPGRVHRAHVLRPRRPRHRHRILPRNAYRPQARAVLLMAPVPPGLARNRFCAKPITGAEASLRPPEARATLCPTEYAPGRSLSRRPAASGGTPDPWG